MEKKMVSNCTCDELTYSYNVPKSMNQVISNDPGLILKSADEYGDANIEYLWYPYLPLDVHSVLMGAGGSGKTNLCCAIAACISSGKALPGDREPRKAENVLMISAEDAGEELKQRLEHSGAALGNVFICDRASSGGIVLSPKNNNLQKLIEQSDAKLVIIDPWQAFIDPQVNVNQINKVRPISQYVSNVAKEYHCAIILISNVNKGNQKDNANNAALGSVDLINASRSAMQLVYNAVYPLKFCVHTKANYSPLGPTFAYRIKADGGVAWENIYPDITKDLLEEAAKKHKNPIDYYLDKAQESMQSNLLSAIFTEADIISASSKGFARYSYAEFREKYGENVFGTKRPKDALDAINGQLQSNFNIKLETGKHVKRNGDNHNSFNIIVLQNSEISYSSSTVESANSKTNEITEEKNE